MNFSCPDREFKVGNCQILVFCGFLFTVTFKALWGGSQKKIPNVLPVVTYLVLSLTVLSPLEGAACILNRVFRGVLYSNVALIKVTKRGLLTLILRPVLGSAFYKGCAL